MEEPGKLNPILVVDDDKDDRMFLERALREKGVRHPIQHLSDGEDMMDCLKKRGRFSKADGSRPCLIILDLNMPRMDGRKALLFVKSDPELKQIPVLVLSTSGAEEDILRSYNLGANSFLRKPVHYDGFISLADSLANYWLGMVSLPCALRDIP